MSRLENAIANAVEKMRREIDLSEAKRKAATQKISELQQILEEEVATLQDEGLMIESMSTFMNIREGRTGSILLTFYFDTNNNEYLISGDPIQISNEYGETRSELRGNVLRAVNVLGGVICRRRHYGVVPENESQFWSSL